MTRYLFNLLGVILAACATSSLMVLSLQFDYSITTTRPAHGLWLHVVNVIGSPLGAALFFTAAQTARK